MARPLDQGLIIGLMSGTSADGIDSCLVQLAGHGFDMRFRILAHRSDPHPRSIKEEIGALARPGVRDFDVLDRLLHLDLKLGHAFAGAALQVAEDAGVSLDTVAAVGLHGQTLRHRPPQGGGEWSEGASLQVGSAAVIAETLGVRVVHDFRARDMACGGQGAPLVPLVDLGVLGGRDRPSVALNLGGIANLTYVPTRGREQMLLAYDTGPANSLLDATCRLSGKVREGYDRGGRRAARGKVDAALLEELLAHPYLAKDPPKSTGPEEFGEEMVEGFLERLALDDLLATLAAFTARTVADQVRFLAEIRRKPSRVVVSGGGARNAEVMRRLEEELGEVPVVPSDELGIPAEAKEAFAFAILAHQTLHGRAGNLPAATGARAPRVLGSIIPA